MKNRVFLVAFLLVSMFGWSDSLDESKAMEIQCSIKPIDRAKIHPKGKASRTKLQAFSTNWSGYVAAQTLSQSATNSVSFVAGSWVVPALLPTPDNSYCAIWIGIDGYLDGTVEQMGTAHDWVNGAQENFAWFEMYPMGAFEIGGFPADVGDQISVHLGYKGNDVFKLVMFNYTKGVFTTIPTSYTTAAGVQRSSAEWIVEAPFSGGVLPLSDFKPITFNYCSATINGITGAINNGHWVEDSITMTGSAGIKAQPSVLLKNGTAFTVTWDHE